MAYSPEMSTPVNRMYYVPHVSHLVFEAQGSGTFTIYDSQGDLLFDVYRKFLPILRTKYVLRDIHGHTILVMKKKFAMHDSWTVRRGDNKNEKLFTVTKTSVYQSQLKFEVILSANTTSAPNFVIRGDIVQDNYFVFYESTPIAEIRKKLNTEIAQYEVTVASEVDRAFVAALSVICDRVTRDGKKAQQIFGKNEKEKTHQIIRKVKKMTYAVIPMAITISLNAFVL